MAPETAEVAVGASALAPVPAAPALAPVRESATAAELEQVTAAAPAVASASALVREVVAEAGARQPDAASR